ncbi:MAG TPA: sigma-70 family RNA polymerase sigma factor [Actinocatenispora sp.]
MGEADEFEAHRRHLLGVAYRMLGSWAEAEDAVQETWLRWTTADRSGVESARGWLTTVTGRICLDVLRSARVRRESYVGPWLPEPLVERLADPLAMDPGEKAARTDEVNVALLAVLEKLTPEQRVAFVLHDVFDVPFEQVAATLGGSVEAARQLASRARRAVKADTPKHTAELAEQRTVLTAFLRACREGDLEGLLAVLAPDVTFVGDGGGAAPAIRVPIVELPKVARFLLGLGRRAVTEGNVTAEPVLVNGDLGVMFHYEAQDLTSVMSFAYADGRVTAIQNQLNPAKLTHVPEPDRGHSVWPVR